MFTLQAQERSGRRTSSLQQRKTPASGRAVLSLRETSMKAGKYLMGCASTFAIAAVVAGAASAHPIFYPHKRGAAVHFASARPLGHVGPYEGPYVARKPLVSGTWTDVTATLPFTNGPWAPHLLTDGTVLIQDYCTSQWYKLTPDSKG